MLPNKEGTTTRLWCVRTEPECDQSGQHQLLIYRMYRGEHATWLHRDIIGERQKTNDLVSSTDCKSQNDFGSEAFPWIPPPAVLQPTLADPLLLFGKWSLHIWLYTRKANIAQDTGFQTQTPSLNLQGLQETQAFCKGGKGQRHSHRQGAYSTWLSCPHPDMSVVPLCKVRSHKSSVLEIVHQSVCPQQSLLYPTPAHYRQGGDSDLTGSGEREMQGLPPFRSNLLGQRSVKIDNLPPARRKGNMLSAQLKNLSSHQHFPSGSFKAFLGNHLCTKVFGVFFFKS